MVGSSASSRRMESDEIGVTPSFSRYVDLPEPGRPTMSTMRCLELPLPDSRATSRGSDDVTLRFEETGRDFAARRDRIDRLVLGEAAQDGQIGAERIALRAGRDHRAG